MGLGEAVEEQAVTHDVVVVVAARRLGIVVHA
jgi:hypothetical protein